jgi:hypothetical protein
MSKTNEELATARDILDKHRKEIKATWHTTGTAIGYKIRKGKITDEIAIIFYVKKKKSYDDLLSEGIEPIPEYFHGCRTDVQELKIKKRI